MFFGLLSIFLFTKASLGSMVCSERLLPGLSDDKITASSVGDTLFQPAYARLDSELGLNWCSSLDDKAPYIQVKMDPTTVGGIITQGHYFWHIWVKKYYVKYSEDGDNWMFVKEPSGSNKVFIGNSDRNTWVTNKFNNEIKLQFLRIYPIEWEMLCCLRFDVIGCQDGMTTTAMTESVNEPKTCSDDTQATPIRPVTSVMTTIPMVKSVLELTTFTEEIQVTSTKPAVDVMTSMALRKSVQELTTFNEAIQATPTRRAPFVTTTMKFLHESTESKYMSTTKNELSTLTDVLPFASSTSSVQSMTSMSPNNCGETLNEGNATTEPRCYMACSKNHTEQELVEMVDKLKQELRTDKKKTSMYIRSKTSASDERKSSAAIGCVGVAILCAVGIGILLLDLPHLVQFLKHIKVNKKVTPAVRA